MNWNGETIQLISIRDINLSSHSTIPSIQTVASELSHSSRSNKVPCFHKGSQGFRLRALTDIDENFIDPTTTKTNPQRRKQLKWSSFLPTCQNEKANIVVRLWPKYYKQSHIAYSYFCWSLSSPYHYNKILLDLMPYVFPNIQSEPRSHLSWPRRPVTIEFSKYLA